MGGVTVLFRSRSQTRAPMTMLALLLSCGFVLLPARASSPAARLVGPRQVWDAVSLSPYDPSHLYFKFVEGADVRLQNGGFVDESGSGLAAVGLALNAPGVTILGATFGVDRSTARQRKSIGEARS